MSQTSLLRTFVSSPQNPRVKGLVRLRTRRERERKAAFLVEGRREVRRALAWKSHMVAVYCCPSLYVGESEEKLLAEAAQAAEVVEMSEPGLSQGLLSGPPGGIVGGAAPARAAPRRTPDGRRSPGAGGGVGREARQPRRDAEDCRSGRSGCGGGGRSDHRCLQPQRGARLPGIALHRPLWPWRTAKRHWGGSARWACG